MKKNVTKGVVAAALLFALTCIACKTVEEAPNTNANVPTVELTTTKTAVDSDDSQELDLIDAKLKSIGETSLRKLKLDAGEFEIRIWAGYGIRNTRGLMIKRNGSGWKGKVVTIEPSSKKATINLSELNEPKTGWQVFWDKLQSHGILTIRDDSEVGAVEPFEDSQLVIVETLAEGKYRSYSYNSPCFSKTDDGRELVELLKFVDVEFGVKLIECEKE